MRTSLFAVTIALLMSACGATPQPTKKASSGAMATTPAQAPAPQAMVVKPVQVPSGTLTEAPPLQTPPLSDALPALLTYSERLRQLNLNDLAAEIALQGEPGNAPVKQMQLALALMHLPLPVDTARALGLLQRVASSAAPEAAPLKPLAGLLAYRLLEQRKLEESLERQGQQLRDNQRRIDQLSDRLEAMRAIERSLTTRPPGATNGTRPALP